MKQLDRLLEKIDLSKTVDEQLDTLKYFDNITEEEIASLVSTAYVKSSEAGIVISYLGSRYFFGHIPALLIFLQDLNWPASGYVVGVLQDMGKPVIPAIREAFKDEIDSIWHKNILLGICIYWDLETKRELLDDYLRLASKGDREGASLAALRILHELLEESEFQNQTKVLRYKFKDDNYWLNQLDETLVDLEASR